MSDSGSTSSSGYDTDSSDNSESSATTTNSQQPGQVPVVPPKLLQAAQHIEIHGDKLAKLFVVKTTQLATSPSPPPNNNANTPTLEEQVESLSVALQGLQRQLKNKDAPDQGIEAPMSPSELLLKRIETLENKVQAVDAFNDDLRSLKQDEDMSFEVDSHDLYRDAQYQDAKLQEVQRVIQQVGER